MKKETILKIVFLIIFLLSLNLYAVNAYSGELAPDGYINFSSKMNIEGNKAIGTITLGAAVSGYSISYEKVDVTENILNTITTKYNNYVQYSNEAQQTLNEKQTNVQQLQTEYQNLANSTTATDAEKTAAQNALTAAVEDYNQYLNTATEQLKSLHNDFVSSAPSYTGAWQNTTNTTNNVEIDLSNYTGTIYYVLWAKITNGTNTYYNFTAYQQQVAETIEINKNTASIKVNETIQLTATSSANTTITWTSSDPSVATVSSTGLVKGIKPGTTVITAKGLEKTATCTVTVTATSSGDTEQDNTSTDDGLTWTDFSNATIEMTSDRTRQQGDAYNAGFKVAISNIQLIEGHYYEIYLSTDKNFNDFNDKSSNYFGRINNDDMYSLNCDSVYELNGDIYLWIKETDALDNSKIVLAQKKVDRLSQMPLGGRLAVYISSWDTSVHKYENNLNTNRKVKYKIGLITDNEILKSIKNGEKDCLSKLLAYAKSATNGKTGTINYPGTQESITENLGIVHGAYYYGYFELDDENGKYYPVEDIMLYQGLVSEHLGASFYNYLDSQFVWNLSDDGSSATTDDGKDTTTAKDPIPDTGKTLTIVGITIVTITMATISIIKYRKYRDI